MSHIEGLHHASVIKNHDNLPMYEIDTGDDNYHSDSLPDFEKGVTYTIELKQPKWVSIIQTPGYTDFYEIMPHDTEEEAYKHILDFFHGDDPQLMENLDNLLPDHMKHLKDW